MLMLPVAAPNHRALTTVLAATLLSACASGRIAARDESAERIETAIGVPALEEPFPDGLPFYAESPPISDALAMNEAEEEEEE
ncbi:hypothetical protein HUW62_16300 [Myxococcus sp. AM011]|uniref:hypothetical protein n=1 Tax=Myxococcus sp. AM011 TaxID=2745200 RepID=UPI0015950338|nr:hypothetical protein [Myxococcus sp. AM011]NVJ22782.1 hypothetical protein [Myxococcus sp. AM011]